MATSLIGPGNVNSQMTLQQLRQTQLLQQGSFQSTLADAGKDDAKIEKGARQFESMLLSSWLQASEKSFATVPGADDDDDGDGSGKDQMMSLGVQSLADSLAASGGIGIARMISKAMHATAEKVEKEHSEASEAENQGRI